MRRSHEQFTLPTGGKWWNCQKSADCTIGTSAVPPEFLLAWRVEGFGLFASFYAGAMAFAGSITANTDLNRNVFSDQNLDQESIP